MTYRVKIFGNKIANELGGGWGDLGGLDDDTVSGSNGPNHRQ